jgi:hypothetical protein
MHLLFRRPRLVSGGQEGSRRGRAGRPAGYRSGSVEGSTAADKHHARTRMRIRGKINFVRENSCRRSPNHRLRRTQTANPCRACVKRLPSSWPEAPEPWAMGIVDTAAASGFRILGHRLRPSIIFYTSLPVPYCRFLHKGEYDHEASLLLVLCTTETMEPSSKVKLRHAEPRMRVACIRGAAAFACGLWNKMPTGASYRALVANPLLRWRTHLLLNNT